MTDLDRIAAQYPIGAKIRYYPVLPPVPGMQAFIPCLIRSKPWRVGSGHIVTKITGVTGGVSVNHIIRDDKDGTPVAMSKGDPADA